MANIEHLLQQLNSWMVKPSELTGDLPTDKIIPNPDDVYGKDRRLVRVPPKPVSNVTLPTIQQVQDMLAPAIRDYLDEKEPDYMLLVMASPGTGKTTAAVRVAEECAQRGKRVFYAGPRINFYEDVINASSDPSLFYPWLPRQSADEETGKCETCIHHENITKWMGKGYKSVDFCKSVCGWEYYNDGCVYNAQKKRPEPIIYGNHLHVVLGHPLEFNIVIGDEDPTTAFLHEWDIPNNKIMPKDMPFTPYKELLSRVQILARSTDRMTGDELVELLGADEVLRAVENHTFTPDIIAPDIKYSDDAESVDYNHIFDLAKLLKRQAAAKKLSRGTPTRIYLEDGNLKMLLRKQIDWSRIPGHVVWLDATANESIYETTFKRKIKVVDARAKLKGRIFQVYDRLNGKGSMIEGEEITGKSDQAKVLIDSVDKKYKYDVSVVISYQQYIEKTEFERDMMKGHFYAARGTNEYEEADAIYVLGAPMPPTPQIVKMAKMIFFDRDVDFDTRWSSPFIPTEGMDGYEQALEVWQRRSIGQYNYTDKDGMGRAYPCSGFYNDDQLQSVLWSMREAEIIQAAHRVRPARRNVDIWLLTNLAIDALPPTELLTMRDILDAPKNVDIFKWEKVIGEVERIFEEKGVVTIDDLAATGISYPTARKYFDVLEASGEWKPVRALVKTGGSRPRTIARTVEL